MQKQIPKLNPLKRPSTPVKVEVQVEFHRCIYLFGATKNHRLGMTVRYSASEDGREPFTFDEPFESWATEVITNSGARVPKHIWFDGVDWSEWTDGLKSA